MDSFLKREKIQADPGAWSRRVTLLAGVAVVALAVSLFGFLRDHQQFAFSWLVPFLFFLTIALAGLFFVLLQHLTRAGWSVAVRRIPETMGSTIPVFALLFLPVVFGIGELYHWAEHGAADHDALLQHKAPYLNTPFFLVRAGAYFVIWFLLAAYFHRSSLRQDTTADPRTTVTLQRRAAPAMILFAVTLSFMAFDWIMSLDPHWFSTIFGVYIFSGSALAGFAVIVLVALALQRGGYLREVIRLDHYRDLGRLIFAFSVFWAYIAFSQYFLIWYGNIPEETIFYLHRMEGNWKQATWVLAAGHFVVPFVILMSRWSKNRPQIVGLMAVWVLLMHYLDLYWLVMPVLHHEGIHLHWMDLAALAAVGAVFLAVFIRLLGSKPLVPLGDPRLPESLKLHSDY